MDHVTSSTPDAGSMDALREFRALIDTRREAEDVLAEALATRKKAASYAEEIIRHAEVVARELEVEARRTAAATTSDAELRARQIIADAEARSARVDDRAHRAVRRLEALAGEVSSTLADASAELTDAIEAGEPVSERRHNPFRAIH